MYPDFAYNHIYSPSHPPHTPNPSTSALGVANKNTAPQIWQVVPILFQTKINLAERKPGLIYV